MKSSRWLVFCLLVLTSNVWAGDKKLGPWPKAYNQGKNIPLCGKINSLKGKRSQDIARGVCQGEQRAYMALYNEYSFVVEPEVRIELDANLVELLKYPLIVSTSDATKKLAAKAMARIKTKSSFDYLIHAMAHETNWEIIGEIANTLKTIITTKNRPELRELLNYEVACFILNQMVNKWDKRVAYNDDYSKLVSLINMYKGVNKIKLGELIVEKIYLQWNEEKFGKFRPNFMSYLEQNSSDVLNMRIFHFVIEYLSHTDDRGYDMLSASIHARVVDKIIRHLGEQKYLAARDFFLEIINVANNKDSGIYRIDVRTARLLQSTASEAISKMNKAN